LQLRILNCHENQKQAKFVKFGEHLRCDEAANFDECHQSLLKIKWCHDMEHKVESVQKLCFHCDDLLRAECTMCDFFGNDARFERVGILEFGGEKDCCETYAVHILVVDDSVSLLLQQIAVEKSNCEEVGATRTLEGRAYFDHPVNHLGSVLGGYTVVSERVLVRS
jgi:hypothetical protein